MVLLSSGRCFTSLVVVDTAAASFDQRGSTPTLTSAELGTNVPLTERARQRRHGVRSLPVSIRLKP